MKKNRAMKKIKELSNLLVIFAVVLLYFSPVATACPDPECDDCYTWNGEECVYDCGSGQSCCGGSCCNYDCCGSGCCPPSKCCDGQCVSTCWTTEQVSSDYESCPDCVNSIPLCSGTTESAEGYTKCVSATTGQSGLTKCTSKQTVIGYSYVCDDADWDGSKILGCAVGAGLCGFACGSPNMVCVLCLIAEGAACALDGVCGFVDSCGPSAGQQGTPIYKQVVDEYGGCGCTG